MNAKRRIRGGRRRPAVALGLVGVSACAGLVLAPAQAAPVQGGIPSTGAGKAVGSTNTMPAPPAPPAGIPQMPSWATSRSQFLTDYSNGAPYGQLLGDYSQLVADYQAQGLSLYTIGSTGAPTTTTSANAPASAIKLSSPGTGTWGPPGPATALVLYDTTGQYGFLGAMYALAAGNLATHFGQVTAEPVADYQAGQVNAFTATVYLGSTYNEPIPAALSSDVMSTTHPVIWAGDNVWQLSGTEGSSTDSAFEAKYGWDASSSYFTTTSAFNGVQYHGQVLSRFDGSGADPILNPDITDPASVSVLADAVADPAVRSGYTTVPWAVRSSNLTYLGEVPFSYVNETDRVMAFESMLFDALAPGTQSTRRALVRLEDLTAVDDQAQIRQIGSLLKQGGIPFSFNVIPQYEDPNGYYDGGKPLSISLKQSPQFVQTIRDLIADGGSMVDEGYTHQYSNVANPYDGVSGDDFEFYRAQCAASSSPPWTFATGTCPDADYVVEQGPVPNDSASWATGRMQSAKKEFTSVGLPVPSMFLFPHYAASMVDYQAAATQYQAFYDRRLYYGASLTGGSADYSYGKVLGQYFPYTVTDVYGSKIIPENLGDYEPSPINNSPTRLPADIVHEAQLNTVTPDAVASFFYDPTNGSSALTQILSGIQGAGYTFVSAQSLLANP